MTSRTKKVIGAVVLALVIILLALFLWLSGGEQPPSVVNTGNFPANAPSGGFNSSSGGVQFDVTQVTEPVRTPEEVAAPDQQTNLKRIAAAFAERYGSYSNQGDYRNLEELQSLMTDSMAAVTADYVARARSESAASPEYVGVTTRALVTEVDRFDLTGGEADVRVNTQREEITAAGSRVYYQELNLRFVMVGELWKVDSVEWSEGG
ncbi:MAG: hypothetical protein ABIJ46_02845 [bacterium]